MSMISEQIKTLETLSDELSNHNMKISSLVINEAIQTIKELSAKVHENNMHGRGIPIEERIPEDHEIYVCNDCGKKFIIGKKSAEDCPPGYPVCPYCGQSNVG